MAKKRTESRTEDLRKLGKTELLEIMLAQSREIDRLRRELELTRRELHRVQGNTQKEIRTPESGNTGRVRFRRISRKGSGTASK